MKWGRMVVLAALAAVLTVAGTVAAMRSYVAREAAALEEPPLCVVIDAGHGGEDGGATSISGARESRINLEIAHRADDLLAFLGYRTRMVRTGDEAVYDSSAKTISEKKVSDLKNHVKLVGETPGALLLSIHQNTFSDGKYAGAQVFFAPTDGSQELAENVQASLRALVDPNNHRKVKRADSVYLMNHIQCPGVLVECGFLSNREEDRLLQTPDYQKKLTLAIADGIAAWVSGKEKNEI